MKLPRYNLSSDSQLTTFEFVSEGPNGRIVKLVQYSPTNLKNVYNLAFGDKNGQTGEINDLTISNNGDSEKILATVVSTVYAFTDQHPVANIYATGSTESRTRLYRIGITKYIEEISEHFHVYGELDKGWEKFEKDRDYLGFLVYRK
ncbi:hypothetical protein N6H18_02655 [Reichenbachiella agarivorans]|uniref:Uncharacterized protein n=1 Tax=Reichenbachiella agarivorans TaxID=2979464 RepID=A0ABY6CQR3_9BACT|nr:hypothetical protein [Reichenbachiella agarivorans]UXP32857.1 hypothetical protein N6H18_02655 [Reichenbachiella agarivorans]